MSDDGSSAGRVNSWGVALFGGGLISGLAALISGIAAFYSQERATAASQSAKAAETSFEVSRSERQDQFLIYERVERQLANNNAAGIILAASYVALIKSSDAKQNLCRVINIVTDVRWETLPEAERAQYRTALRDVGAQMQACISRARGKIERETTLRNSAAAPPAPLPPASLPDRPLIESLPEVEAAPGLISSSRIVNTAPVKLKGWDIDVFWCQARGEPSRLLAQKVAAKLGALTSDPGVLAGQQLGQVRLRSVTKFGEEKLKMFKGNSVVGSADEAAIATALSNALNSDGTLSAQFPFRQTSTLTRWYVSVFACDFPEV